MKTIPNFPCPSGPCDRTAYLRGSEHPFRERVRELIHTVSAARGGLARLTLRDWRELEQEIQTRLQNESISIQP
jgi:hypothetical protein